MELEAIIRKLAAEESEKATAPLLHRIAELEKLQDEWVTVKEAEKRTGKSRKTLLKEANRKGTLLLTKIENKRTRLYSAASIVNYNNRKVLVRNPDSLLKIAA